MEARLNHVLTTDIDKLLNAREHALEERLISVVDNQAKDIAFDFTNLD